MANPRSKLRVAVIVSALLHLLVAGTVHAQTLQGRVVAITDGDTFTLLTDDKEQVRVRVAEIDAPERGQPYGDRSRQELSRLIFGEDVSVEIQVVDRYGRPVGRPVVGNMDVTEEMVRTGAAWVYRTYSDDENLYALEREAKANRQGIWGLSEYERVPPWDWRQGKRNASTSESTRSIRSSSSAAFPWKWETRRIPSRPGPRHCPVPRQKYT